MRRISPGLMGLAGAALLMIGCSNAGPCKKACTKIAGCMGIDLSKDGATSSWSCPYSEACGPEESCLAQCVDEAACPAILGEDAAQVQELTRCQEVCSATSPPDGGGQARDRFSWDGSFSAADRTPLPPRDGPPLRDDGPPMIPDTGPWPTGAVIITELMPNPAAVSDGNGEYFELYNADSGTIDLNGWTFQDNSAANQTINVSGGLLIKPGQYLVLGVNGDMSANGGTPVDYDYSVFTLNNDTDQLQLYNAGGGLVDSLVYTASWGISAGASLSLKSTSLDNDDGENWCLETSAWSGSAGDKGTPGGPAKCN